MFSKDIPLRTVLFLTFIFYTKIKLSSAYMCNEIEDSEDVYLNASITTPPPDSESQEGCTYNPMKWNMSNDELARWRGPNWFYTEYPIYFSGRDYDDVPIWVAELGHFDMIRVVRGGEQIKDAWRKYMEQSINMVRKSWSPDYGPGSIIIVDVKDFSLAQILSPSVVSYILNMFRTVRKGAENYTKQVVIINLNYPSELILNLTKGVFPKLFEKMVVFGTNRERWLPHLRSTFPHDQLPSWYGGSKEHKPLFLMSKMAV